MRVSLSQTYPSECNRYWDYFQGGRQYIDGWTLVITAGNLSAETNDFFYQTDAASSAEVEISSVSPCPPSSEVSVNGNRLKFPTLAKYEQYADNELDRSTLTNLAVSNSSVTTLEEINNEQDTLNPEFLKQILNDDLIVEAGSFLIKVDLQNERVLAIQSSNTNAYQSLVSNNLNATGMMNFDTDVSNGVEIWQAIENGTLQVSNYQSATERSTSFIKNTNSFSESLVETQRLSQV